MHSSQESTPTVFFQHHPHHCTLGLTSRWGLVALGPAQVKLTGGQNRIIFYCKPTVGLHCTPACRGTMGHCRPPTGKGYNGHRRPSYNAGAVRQADGNLPSVPRGQLPSPCPSTMPPTSSSPTKRRVARNPLQRCFSTPPPPLHPEVNVPVGSSGFGLCPSGANWGAK